MTPLSLFSLLCIFIALIQIYLFFGALIKLRYSQINETARVLWVFLVVLVPLLGPVALFVVSPDLE